MDKLNQDVNNNPDKDLDPDEVESVCYLENSKLKSTLIDHHKLVVQYYIPRNQKIMNCTAFTIGDQFNKDIRDRISEKGRVAIPLDYIRPSYRSVLGILTNNKYDVTFAPREEDDQQISDILKNWYDYNAYQGDFQSVDNEAFMNAWAGGTGYIETYIVATPGKRPIIKSEVLNSLAVYFDPESSKPGTREDADFVDRVLWMTKKSLQLKFPWCDFSSLTNNTSTYYKKYAKHLDNRHEYLDTSNNTYKVIQRLYKVKKNGYFSIDEEFNKNVLDESTAQEMMKSGQEVQVEPIEYLYTAICVPAMMGTDYIYNGEYYCQPRKQRSLEVIFPIMEIPAEKLAGTASGFVEFLIPAQMLINNYVTQLNAVVQHQTSANHFVKGQPFISVEERARFTREKTMPDKTFFLDDQADPDSITLVPKEVAMNPNAANLFNIALSALKEISSTNNAVQGITENSSVSGVLNQQRIDQGLTQLQGFIGNIKLFLKMRAEIMLSYFMEFKEAFVNESFRVLNKKNPNDPNRVTIMEPAPEMNEFGEWTGAFIRLNDPTTYDYDLDIVDSVASPSQREKTIKAISDILSQGMTASDPVLTITLVKELISLLDLPTNTKDKLDLQAQQAQQQQQTENANANSQAQLDQHSQAINNLGQVSQQAQQAAGPPNVPPQE